MRSQPIRVTSVMEAFVDAASERAARDIRKMRWSLGLTQQEMADRLDLSLLEVEYIESGYCRVAEETFSEIAERLGAKVSAA